MPSNENTDAVMESGLNVNTYTLNSIGNGSAEKESESNFPDYYSTADNPMPASTFHNPVTLQEIEQESDTRVIVSPGTNWANYSPIITNHDLNSLNARYK